MNILPVVLIAAVITQTACQVFKVIIGSIRNRRLQINLFFQSGGMPSSHAAFVTALCAAVAVRNGICSDIFAVSAVFAFIVIHDAVRLRGTVAHQGDILRRLTEDRPDIDVRLPETIGHDIQEIAVGIVIGLVCGIGSAMIFQ